ncbi:hypothetical protein [Microcoleus sp. herbarium2]|uniref:hypothetical protein n=1 Tax=Microcoleus sp. herbarium2 TaxID=3055433 RepID=UPI002FD27B77
MISGIVTDRHAIVALTFLLPSGATFPIEFVIDTGFTDYLCLPPALNFYPYGYAKSAIFVKSDRTLASCNLNRMRGTKPQNPFNNRGFRLSILFWAIELLGFLLLLFCPNPVSFEARG